MNFDHSKLRGKIYEKFRSQRQFAQALGISPATLNHRLSGKLPFTAPEMFKAIRLLEIDPSEISKYFLTLRKEKTQ